MQSTTKNKFWKIEQLHKILFVKKKNTAHAAQRWFCRVNRRQNESGVLRGGEFFRDNPRRGSVQNEHDHILWKGSNQSTRAVGFTRKIPLCVKIVKRVLRNLLKWSVKSATHLVSLGKIRYVNQNNPHFLSAVDLFIAGSNRMLHFWPLSNNRCKKCRGKTPQMVRRNKFTK